MSTTTDEGRKVAPRRMILENPATPGSGIIVAAGDEIPAYAAGYIENTPNKVDAARNMEEADAADQAATRPPERIVKRFGNEQETHEIAVRVAGNRRQFDEELQHANDPQKWLPREKFFDGREAELHAAEHGADENETEGPALKTLTVPQLDELADGLGDGKPENYKGNKAEKVAALEGKVTQSDINRVAEGG